MGDTFREIEDAIEAAEKLLPFLLSAVAPFYSGAGSLAKFLPLLGVALNGVKTVQQATGHAPIVAAAAVADHLIPGQPDAPSLAASGNDPLTDRSSAMS